MDGEVSVFLNKFSKLLIPSSSKKTVIDLKTTKIEGFNPNHLNAHQNHGFAAEVMNHLYDVEHGKKAFLIGGNNTKYGADRLVSGKLIQTKYCKSGSACISCLFNKEGAYKYKDMLVEIPHDKEIYDSALKIFRKKISEGKVPGVKNPKDAEKILLRGQYTYKQAKIAADTGKFTMIQQKKKLLPAAAHDLLCSSSEQKEAILRYTSRVVIVVSVSVGLSSALSFCMAKLQGKSTSEALVISFCTAMAVGGTTFLSKLAHDGGKLLCESKFVQKPLIHCTERSLISIIGYKGAASIVNMIRRVNGKPLLHGAAASKHLAKLMRTEVLGFGVGVGIDLTIETMFLGVDVVRFAKGSISKQQICVNTSGRAASVCGSSVGALIGSSVGSSVGSIAGGSLGTLTLPFVGTVGGAGLGMSVGAVSGGFVGGISGRVAATIVSKKSLKVIMKEDHQVKKIFKKKICPKVLEQLAFDFLIIEQEKTLFRKMVERTMKKELKIKQLRKFFINKAFGGDFKEGVEEYAFKLFEPMFWNIVSRRDVVDIEDYLMEEFEENKKKRKVQGRNMDLPPPPSFRPLPAKPQSKLPAKPQSKPPKIPQNKPLKPQSKPLKKESQQQQQQVNSKRPSVSKNPPPRPKERIPSKMTNKTSTTNINPKKTTTMMKTSTGAKKAKPSTNNKRVLKEKMDNRKSIVQSRMKQFEKMQKNESPKPVVSGVRRGGTKSGVVAPQKKKIAPKKTTKVKKASGSSSSSSSSSSGYTFDILNLKNNPKASRTTKKISQTTRIHGKKATPQSGKRERNSTLTTSYGFDVLNLAKSNNNNEKMRKRKTFGRKRNMPKKKSLKFPPPLPRKAGRPELRNLRDSLVMRKKKKVNTFVLVGSGNYYHFD